MRCNSTNNPDKNPGVQQMPKTHLSYDYIRGLAEGEGTFTFSTSTVGEKKRKIPAFAISMNARDKELLGEVGRVLKLKNKVYVYHYQGHDGYKRGPRATLIVREFGQLKNIIVPLFYGRLIGNKGKQFNEWLEKIGTDPDVPETFRFIHFLHKKGFYNKNPKY